MKKMLSVMALCVCCMGQIIFANSAPTVKYVAAKQRTDGSGIVDIYYTLSDADGDKCTVSIQVDDGSGNWNVSVSASSLGGDLTDVSSARRHIIWNSKADLPGTFGANYRIKVTAEDIHLDDGLVAYYKFDGTSGIVIDETGNNNGTAYGNLTRGVTGKDGNAFEFDGLNDYVEVQDSLPLRLSNTDFTISCWVLEKSRNANSQDAIITKRGDGYENGWFFSIRGLRNSSDGSSGKVYYQVSAGADPRIYSNSVIPLNEWKHIVVSYSNTNQSAKVFIDGILDSVKTTIPAPNPNTSANLFIGNDSLGNSYCFHGKIDELRIYNRALSSTEIKSLYQNP